MGQQYDQSRLTQQGAFTRHVGAGDDDDLLLCIVEVHVIGDIGLVAAQATLDHGVATRADVKLVALVQLWLAIVQLAGIFRKAGKNVLSVKLVFLRMNGSELMKLLQLNRLATNILLLLMVWFDKGRAKLMYY